MVDKATNRPKRMSLEQARVIETTQRPGFVRKYVRDYEVDVFERAGYSVVTGKENNLADKRSDDVSQMGSAVTARLNKGRDATWFNGVLVEIQEEYYKEDIAEEQAQIDALEVDVKRKIHQGQLVDPTSEFQKYK